MFDPHRVLVIKHSALGDFVLATPAFEAIRRHHPDARITLLTTAPYAAMARASGHFDAVWLDDRPSLAKPLALLRLIARLRAARFDRVYDLQRSDRTAMYFRLLGPRRPEWVGTARGASHRYAGAEAHKHIADREREQLALAGITVTGPPDLGFLRSDVDRFALPPRYALLAPGGAPHRPAKRWPADRFAALARGLGDRGIAPVLLGTAAEARENAEIRFACPGAHDLTGQTDFADLATLARRAAVAVGNDTGPMHLLAASGCPCVVLFSAESDPVRVAPRGAGGVRIVRRDSLADLESDEVEAAVLDLMNAA